MVMVTVIYITDTVSMEKLFHLACKCIDLHQVNYLTESKNTVITIHWDHKNHTPWWQYKEVVRSTGQSQPAGSGCNAASSSLDY